MHSLLYISIIQKEAKIFVKKFFFRFYLMYNIEIEFVFIKSESI